MHRCAFTKHVRQPGTSRFVALALVAAVAAGLLQTTSVASAAPTSAAPQPVGPAPAVGPEQPLDENRPPVTTSVFLERSVWTAAGWVVGTNDPGNRVRLISASGVEQRLDPSPLDGSATWRSCQTSVAGRVSFGDGSPDGVAWHDVGTGTRTTANLGRFVQFVGAAPGGWLETRPGATDAVILTHVVPTTGVRTDLTSFPGYVAGAVCGGNRFAVGGPNHLMVGSGTRWTTVASAPDRTYYPMAVTADAVVYLEAPLSGPKTLWRQDTGKAAQYLASYNYATPGPGAVNISADSTYYVHDQEVVKHAVAGSSTVISLSSPQAIHLDPNDPRWLLAVVGSGITRVKPSEGLWLWKTLPHSAAAWGTILGPGRAVWYLEQANTTRQRLVSGASQLVLGTTGPEFGFWLQPVSHLWQARTGFLDGRRIGVGGVSSRLGQAELALPGLDKARGLYGHRLFGWRNGAPTVLDLATGIESGTAYNGTTFLDAAPWSGGWWVQDGFGSGLIVHNELTGASTLAVTTQELFDGKAYSAQRVDLTGDWIAWARSGSVPTTPSDLPQTTVRWKNRATGVIRTLTLPSAYRVNALQIDGAYLLVQGETVTQQSRTMVVNMTSGTTVLDRSATWQSLPSNRMDYPSIGQDRIAWVDGYGAPMIASLPHQVRVPRHEGNPIVPSTFRPQVTDAPWRGEWVFDQPLTWCVGRISTSAGAPIREVGCRPDAARLGEAVVDWDGKDAAGRFLPSATYRIDVVAGDSDGQAVEGSSGGPIPTTLVRVLTGVPSYVPVAPARILETRANRPTVDGVAMGVGRLGPAGTTMVPVLGRAGVPARGVGAVVVNVTGIAPSEATFLTVYPAGVAAPNASTLNLGAGQVFANAAIVKVGTSGAITVANNQGWTDVAVDVVGWFADGATSAYLPIVPARLTDTRSSGPTVDGNQSGTGRLTAGEDRTIPAAGRAGIPTTGVAAVAVNVTGIAPTLSTFLTGHRAGTGVPATSTLNLGAGQVVPNLAVIPTSAAGEVAIANNRGGVHLAVDAAGYFPAGAGFTPVAPVRLLDTRTTSAIGPGSARAVPIRGVSGIPANATAAVVNVTAVAPSAWTYLTAYPSGAPAGATSTLNLPAGDVRANLAIVEIGRNGSISVSNAQGSTHVLVDLIGWLR